jgi:outer membrane protein insertion porin family
MRQRQGFFTIMILVYLMPHLGALTSHRHANAKEGYHHPAAPLNHGITRIVVQVHDLPMYRAELIDLAKNLILLREGDQFSPDLVQESIEALKLSKRFQEIYVDSELEREGIALLFDLKPFRLISDIKIYGEFPLFERELLKAMTSYVGDVYIHEDLHKQASLIAEVFKREGFLTPKVKATAREDPEDGNFTIHITIDKGPYLTLEKLDITGNRAFSHMNLKSRMKIWRASLLPGSSGRFIEGDLAKDVNNLIYFYRKSGYPDAIIEHTITKDPAAPSVSVFVTIHEGSRYEVEFLGNETFGEDTLRKDLILFTEGNKNDLGLRKSVKKIKNRYRMAGFLEAQVKIEEMIVTEKHQTSRMIRFVIEEGPQSIVSSIQLRGNQAFDDERIKKQMLTRMPGFREEGAFVPETLEDDVSAIKSLYRKHGFMDTEIGIEVKRSVDKRNVDITLEIDEKTQTLIASVELIGITAISEQEAYNVLRMKEGKPFRRYMVQSDENSISSLISKRGYPHVRVKGEVSINREESKARVTYYVDEGPHVTMGHVHYTGNFKTRKRILQREFQMVQGEPFSLEKMLESQRDIRNLGIFNSVRFRTIGLKEKREQVHLLVDIEEKKPYFIQAGGGYETSKGFYLNAKAGDHNLFGTNKDAWVAGEMSQIGYHSEFGITEPRLFGTRIATTFGMYSERTEEFNQDFGTKSFGSSLGFSRKWPRDFKAGLNFGFEQREQFKRDSYGDTTDSEDDDIFEPRSILVITPSIGYDTRDSFIRPRRGIFSFFSVDISKGIRNSLDDFFKYSYDVRLYFTPLPRLTFAWLGRAGYIDPFGPAERIVDDQLFYLGGTSDVRGFSENMLRIDVNGDPVGGLSMLAGSAEARIDLGHNVEFTLFYDVGYVGNTYVESVSDDTRSSVGVGLRYVTPVGPIGFLYGIKLAPEEGESPGRLHFSVGYTF